MGPVMLFNKLIRTVVVTAFFTISYSEQVTSAPVCGTGAHWVDTCSAGMQELNITMYFGLDTDLDALANIDVSFSGTVQIQYSDAYASSPISNPTHLDRVDTEIVSMNLSGNEAFVSGWSFHMGANQGLAETFGFVQEQADSSLALNHFDTVFEFRGTPFGTLSHSGTFFFETIVSELLPIGALFNHTGSPFGTTFPLSDENGNQPIFFTDQIITNFTTVGRPHFIIESVTTVPVPAAFWLFISGVSALLGITKRKVHV